MVAEQSEAFTSPPWINPLDRPLRGPNAISPHALTFAERFEEALALLAAGLARSVARETQPE